MASEGVTFLSMDRKVEYQTGQAKWQSSHSTLRIHLSYTKCRLARSRTDETRAFAACTSVET